MPEVTPTRRRARLPAFTALLILLLALGVVVATQVYWGELRGSVDQLHQVMAAASGQQQQMIERLRTAEAALAAVRGPAVAAGRAAAGPAPVDAALPQRLDQAAAEVERLAAAVAARQPVAAPLALAPDPNWLRAELEALAHEALGLPTMRYLPPPGVPDPGLVLRGRDLQRLLRDAASATALGDLPLVTRQVARARQLLGYYRQEPRALALAQRLEWLRDQLSAATAGGADARLEQLAAELRALSRQLPATPAPALPTSHPAR